MATLKENGIKISLVINKEYFKNIINETKCSVCQNIMRNPYECSTCEAIFCYDCVSNNQCSNCSKTTINPGGKVTKKFLSKIEFNCENTGCTEKIKYDEFDRHKEVCNFRKFKCEICKQDILITEKENHLNACKIQNSNSINSFEKHSENLSFNEKEIKAKLDSVYQLQDEKLTKFQDILNNIKIDVKNKLKGLADLIKNSGGDESFDAKNKEELVKLEIKELSTKVIEELIKNSNSNDFTNEINENIEILFKQFNSKELIQEKSLPIKDLLTGVEKALISKLNCLKNEILVDTASLISISSNQNQSTSSVSEGELQLLNKNLLTLNENHKESTNILGKIKEVLSKGDKDENRIDIDINKVTMKFNEEILAKINEKIEEVEKSFENVKTDNETIDKFQNEIENLKSNVSSINSQSKELKKYINESMGDLVESRSSMNDKIIEKLIEIIKKESINSSLDSQTSSQNHFNEQENQEDLKKIVTNFLDQYNKTISNDLKINLDKQLKTLFEHFSNLNSKLKEDTISSRLKNIIENYSQSIASLNSLPEIIRKLKDKFESLINSQKVVSQVIVNQGYVCENNNHENYSELIKKVINNNLESKLNDFQKKIELNFSKKIKNMYELKFCHECKKVDYFFGFTRCEICKLEYCKQCVMLCNGCQKLFCKKCITCSKCGSIYCENCKLDCVFCSKEKREKYCKENCIKQCLYCHRKVCKDCLNECMKCQSSICDDCSKNCKICKKCSCHRCETVSQFKFCFYCRKDACDTCILICKYCDLEICSECYSICSGCKKAICQKCSFKCGNCEEIFCKECSIEKIASNCNKCDKKVCNKCISSIKKCPKCSLSYCKETCCSVCRKCKKMFCNNCNVNCDNCDSYSCLTCMYKCMCDQVIFCETCLFNIIPIGPHECVSFLNGASSFSGVKTRSELCLPKNFEAKFFLEKFESPSLLIGVTDNNSFEEDSMSFIDNIWAFKVKTGEKYSTMNSVEHFSDRIVKEKNSIIMAVRNNQLYFRIEFEEAILAYTLDPSKNYYIYIENDNPNLVTKVVFVYIRKI